MIKEKASSLKNQTMLKEKPLRDQFPRLYQIFEKSNQSDPEKNILFGLFRDNPPTNDLSFYDYWESLFQKIDENNWKIFKAKAAKNLTAIQKNGRIRIIGEPRKKTITKIFPPFRCLDIFNEVHGYFFLKNEIVCDRLKFLEESTTPGEKMPDLEGWKDHSQFALDVKTINTSDDQHADFESVVNPIKGDIEFLSPSDKLTSLQSKIDSDIGGAKRQLNSFPHAKKIIFFIINSDSDCNTPHFRNQLSKAIKLNMALVNRDVTICGKFQLDWNPSKGMKNFDWSS